LVVEHLLKVGPRTTVAPQTDKEKPNLATEGT
jgi:hypothetical protein